MRASRILSSSSIVIQPNVFSKGAIPAPIASLNSRLEAAAASTPLLSSSSPKAAREERAKLFQHEMRRKDLRIPPDRADGGVGVSYFVPKVKPRAAYLHLHGGGFIMGSAFGQNDARLQQMADDLQMSVLSVDYSLAPDHRWPRPLDDCVEVALWLAENGRSFLGTETFVVGGESAGAHLCVSMMIRLRQEARVRSNAALEPSALFRCANLVYGWYDLAGTPSMLAFDRRLVFCRQELQWAAEQLVPDANLRARRAGPEAGGVSPLYSDLRGLPPALFTVGTEDPLCDDTLFMAARWAAHGMPAELEIYPGAAHGVGHFGPHQHTEQGKQINARVNNYLNEWIQSNEVEESRSDT